MAMRNAWTLPAGALALAAVLAIILLVTAPEGGRTPLSELELGLVAAIVSLSVYGVQGLLSVALEGEELRPGRHGGRVTNPISVAIVLVSIVLFAIAVSLAWGIAGDWSARRLGILAGAGALILALILVLYKEAFVGDEARFDDRQDGIPW
ncbi:hypothetical protein BH24CHL4_BH24CHL4_17950 [soil metagenome]